MDCTHKPFLNEIHPIYFSWHQLYNFIKMCNINFDVFFKAEVRSQDSFYGMGKPPMYLYWNIETFKCFGFRRLVNSSTL